MDEAIGCVQHTIPAVLMAGERLLFQSQAIVFVVVEYPFMMKKISLFCYYNNIRMYLQVQFTEKCNKMTVSTLKCGKYCSFKFDYEQLKK